METGFADLVSTGRRDAPRRWFFAVDAVRFAAAVAGLRFVGAVRLAAAFAGPRFAGAARLVAVLAEARFAGDVRFAAVLAALRFLEEVLDEAPFAPAFAALPFLEEARFAAVFLAAAVVFPAVFRDLPPVRFFDAVVLGDLAITGSFAITAKTNRVSGTSAHRARTLL